MQKQALAIHDLSCVGRCSLTVALPVLSACGVHASALPTALLSTHTGEFTGYTCLDLTAEMRRILTHFDTLSLGFDAVYSGFLGSAEQISLVGETIRRCRSAGALAVVDPVMADQGRLYATYTPEMAAGMRALCRLADVIVPNVTEACLLLDAPYIPEPDEKQTEVLLKSLAERFRCGQVIITGVKRGGLLGAAGFNASEGRVTFAGAPALPHVFYGTGDVFASALTGALLRGRSTENAIRLAVGFTNEAMHHTLENGLPLRYGVAFEQAIPWLVTHLEEERKP